MKSYLLISVSLVILFSGCADREAEARRAKAEADAKARAEAARKEMNALPEAFQTPDYFKKNERRKKAEPAPESPKASP